MASSCRWMPCSLKPARTWTSERSGAVLASTLSLKEAAQLPVERSPYRWG